MDERSVKDLLPDLPDEEPWFELKFQLWELDWDLKGILARLHEWMPRLGVKEQARELAGVMSELHSEVDHDAQAHAPRLVQLARCLLTLPPESVPEWGDMAGATRASFEIPEEIMSCRWLEQAQASLARHMGETLLAVEQAREAVLRAAEARGSRRAVLEQVLEDATRCCRLLQDTAWPQSEAAFQWARPYWRLMDPRAAAEHDALVAQAEAELEAEPDAREVGKKD